MGVDMSKVRARRAEIKRQAEEFKAGQTSLFLKEGDNFLRILPPRPEADGAWCKRALIHYNLTDDIVLCPKTNDKKAPCPACEYVTELYKSQDSDSKAEAKKFKAKDRFYVNVVSLDKNDGKVYIWDFGQTVEEQIVNIMDPDQTVAGSFGCGDITDPVRGYNLRVTKTVPKDKMQTSYTVAADRVQSPVANWDAIKGNMHNLNDHANKKAKSYEEIKAMLEGGAPPTPQGVNTPPPQKVDPGSNFEPPRTGVPGEFGPPATPVAPAVSQAGTNDGDFASTLARLRGLKK